MVKARGGESLGGRIEIGAIEEKVHVASIANGGSINLGNPGSDGIATDDGVTNVRSFQSARGAEQALADCLDSVAHTPPRNRPEIRERRMHGES